MNGARAALRAELEPRLAGVEVMPYARDLDTVEGDTVMFRLDTVAPSVYGSGMWDYRFGLLLLVPETETGAADDALEALLASTLLAIDKAAAGLTWTEATRAVYRDTVPAFEIKTTLTSTKETPA